MIPIYNGRETICETVNCLLRQSLPAHEIIVVDDGSTDGTAEVLQVFGEKVVVLSKPNGGPASARNQGVRAATGDFIAFTDGDCQPERDWLANLLKGFVAPEVAGVGGAIRRADEGIVSEYVDMIRLFDPGKNGNAEIFYLATGNACFRRASLLDAGLFDERFKKPGGEEPELGMRLRKLGYEFKAVDDAVVLHHHKQSVTGLLKALANYGEGSYLLERKWPELKSYDNPYVDLFKGTIVALRHVPRRAVSYSRRHGVKRGLLFTFLDHFRAPAFAWGYIRGMRNQSQSQSAHPGA